MSRLDQQPDRRAFSLVELLVVLAIIGALAAAALALLNRDTSDTGKRRLALQVLSGAVEQARARAIARGTTVYVAFAGSNQGPEPAGQMLGIYEQLEDPAQPPHPVSSPRRLPEGTLFYQDAHGLFPQSGVQQPREFLFPGAQSPSPAAYLAFDAQGILQSPPPLSEPAGVRLRICYGIWQQGGPVITRKTESGEPVLIPVEITRFTGRIELQGER
jgi:prepilin-type N-terminal cleavage/methylation domain-containing protein